MTKKLSAFEKHLLRTQNKLYKARAKHIEMNIETISNYAAVKTVEWLRRKLIQAEKDSYYPMKAAIDKVLKGEKTK